MKCRQCGADAPEYQVTIHTFGEDRHIQLCQPCAFRLDADGLIERAIRFRFDMKGKTR